MADIRRTIVRAAVTIDAALLTGCWLIYKDTGYTYPLIMIPTLIGLISGVAYAHSTRRRP